MTPYNGDTIFYLCYLALLAGGVGWAVPDGADPVVRAMFLPPRSDFRLILGDSVIVCIVALPPVTE